MFYSPLLRQISISRPISALRMYFHVSHPRDPLKYSVIPFLETWRRKASGRIAQMSPSLILNPTNFERLLISAPFAFFPQVLKEACPQDQGSEDYGYNKRLSTRIYTQQLIVNTNSSDSPLSSTSSMNSWRIGKNCSQNTVRRQHSVIESVNRDRLAEKPTRLSDDSSNKVPVWLAIHIFRNNGFYGSVSKSKFRP